MEVKGIFLGLQHIGVPTRDVKKTVEFYSQFGFETDWADASGSPTFLKCGTCVIEHSVMAAWIISRLMYQILRKRWSMPALWDMSRWRGKSAIFRFMPTA